MEGVCIDVNPQVSLVAMVMKIGQQPWSEASGGWGRGRKRGRKFVYVCLHIPEQLCT